LDHCELFKKFGDKNLDLPKTCTTCQEYARNAISYQLATANHCFAITLTKWKEDIRMPCPVTSHAYKDHFLVIFLFDGNK